MTFSVDTAHALALISKAMYLGPDEIESALTTAWGMQSFEWIDVFDTQACVMHDDERCILAFRGTESVGDWLTDLDLFQVPGVYGMVHHGFQEALDHVWDGILECIDDVYSSGERRPLYVTGHSLGAALATLAVARLGDGTLYTFGSPKVGDEEFAEWFDKRHRSYRFVNNNDMVARVPLTGYEHVSSLRYFTHKGKMWAEPNRFWLTYDRLCGRFGNKIGDGVEDHSIDDYVRLVGKQMVHASWSGVSWG